MNKLNSASIKAIGSVFAPGMLGVFLMSIILTLACLLGFVGIVATVASAFSNLIANPEIAGWLPWLGVLGTSLLSYLLFPGIMPIIVNFFDNKIARLIEERDYRHAAPVEPRFWPEFFHDLRFSLLAIFLNLIILPLYLLPILGQILFFILNGYLLGKEFFVMAARRHLPLADAVALRKAHSQTIFVGGMILTLFATIPFLNLFAPFWGIALMTHLYHSLQSTKSVEILPAE